MLKKIIIYVLVILFSSSLSIPQNLEIIDGWYYINGEKFFVKGIGYETHTRPGQVPWVYSFNPDLIQFDLNRIKSAGFNTIRTWGALTEEELQIVEQSGLKIIFGIWIDPQGNFSDTNFVAQVYNHVNDVLNYSANYNSIIGYLIMNEPQVQHIYNVGAQSLLNLWNQIINLIHNRHPGIPVSFSNTMIGDYINMEIFDFAAYNAYIYNPVTISNSHGYSGFLNYLKENRADNMPFIITEYGLSVSPGDTNNGYGYGGNTIEQQATGNLLMYRGLIDADAQGNCVFQYHDGWWKGGNEYVHDPNPEEWFGLIEFSGLNDIYGSPRPVWEMYGKYNKAIITNPKNEHIYKNVIPLEFFLTNEVASFNVVMNDSILYSNSINSSHYLDEFVLNLDDDIKDVTLDFHFFDSNTDTIKSESISILYTKNDIELPSLTIETLGSFVPGSRNYVQMKVVTNSLFSIDNNKIDYVLHPHIGFDPGIVKSNLLTFNDSICIQFGYFDVPAETKVATFAAGITIRHGDFTKRIADQEILFVDSWADPIASPELITGIKYSDFISSEKVKTPRLYQNFPNPFNPITVIRYSIPYSGVVKLRIHDILGREISTLVNTYKNSGDYEAELNMKDYPSGVYFYTLSSGDFTETKKILLVR
ncbi:MAG: hypothetical protein A2W11_00030 [Ignavibacteria bacterium RBG_16_35_7]|nr:MAG: hypothetical protein A2W11_00030 [Ignavibacteria bacterium RBG_16_35_7]